MVSGYLRKAMSSRTAGRWTAPSLMCFICTGGPFTYFDMGYSCALAWVLVAIIAVFTVILFKTQNNWVHYES